MIFFWSYRLEKVGLFKYLKGTVSEQLWTVSMLKGPKDNLNLHGSIFAIFFVQSETRSAQKILF